MVVSPGSVALLVRNARGIVLPRALRRGGLGVHRQRGDRVGAKQLPVDTLPHTETDLAALRIQLIQPLQREAAAVQNAVLADVSEEAHHSRSRNDSEEVGGI